MVVKERKILSKLYRLLDRREIIILIGSRQVGKTTLLKCMEQKLSSQGKTTAYFNMELPHQLDIFSQRYEDILSHLKYTYPSLNKEKLYLFIDEFQYIPQVNSLLKSFYDDSENIKIVVSGSSSVEIQKKMKESLAGRKREVHIFPLDFYEYIKFKDKSFPEIKFGDVLPKSIIDSYQQDFAEFLVFGGMPAVVLENHIQEKKEMLVELYTTYFQKDIRGLIEQERIIHFNHFIKIIANRIGNILVIDNIAGKLGVERYYIRKDIFMLEHTFVNFLLPPFYTNREKELVKAHKTYFYDNGIRNSILNDFSLLDFRMDLGKLVENCIFWELKKNLSIDQRIYFWRKRNQTEIDFVIQIGRELIPIEVKASKSEKIFKNVKAFIDKYNSKRAFILNRDVMKIKKYKQCDVYFLPSFFAFEITKMIEAGDK